MGNLVNPIFALFYLCINISIFILGAFFLKTAIKPTPHLVDPPDKYLFGILLLDSQKIKKATVRKVFIILHYILGMILIIASINMLVFFVKS